MTFEDRESASALGEGVADHPFTQSAAGHGVPPQEPSDLPYDELGTLDVEERADAVDRGRLHRSWRIRVRPAPFDIGEGWHVIEQQAYADAGEVIEALDLLCSGFNVERVIDRRGC